jgi:hypothetical protein
MEQMEYTAPVVELVFWMMSGHLVSRQHLPTRIYFVVLAGQRSNADFAIPTIHAFLSITTFSHVFSLLVVVVFHSASDSSLLVTS